MAKSHENTNIQSYVKERLIPNTAEDITTYRGNLQESKRLQLSRSTPNLVEFDKPLTVRQDSAESLSSLVAANTLDTSFKPIQPPNPPKKFPRTFEYENEKSSMQTSSRTSAFTSTKVRYRSRTETQQINLNEVNQAARTPPRPVSLYKDPPRSEYHLRFQSQQDVNSNKPRPLSGSVQQVKFRTGTEGATSDLRRRRDRVISYPNIKPGEYVSSDNQITNSPKLQARFSLPADTNEKVKFKNGKNEMPHSKRRSSKEELNLWRSTREITERSRHNSQEQKMYNQENCKTSPSMSHHLPKQSTAYEALFTYNSQTYPYKNQQNGFYKDLELTPNYNSTGRPRKVARDQSGLASPARSLSDRSTASGTPRMERRYKPTSYEDGMTNGLYVPKSSRASKSPQMSRGSGSPHSSHSDPQEQETSRTRSREPEGIAGRSVRLTNGIDIQNGVQNGSPVSVGQHHVSFQQDIVQQEEQFNDQQMQPHAKLIEDNMDVLCEEIVLNESGLWEVLLAKGIVTRRKCDRIKAKYPNEAEQIRQVLQILEKCSGEDFKAFKAALEATGQGHIVENLLLSTVGNRAIDRWRIALARFYLDEAQLDELPLYPLDNSWQTSDINKYYTRTTFADVTGRGRFFDERHFDAYSQLFVDRGVMLRRLAVVGGAGSGKSTLARKITLDWAHHVLDAYLHPDKKSRDSGRGEEENCLGLFQLLVYIDLENISHNATVRDVLLQRINRKDESDCSGIDGFLRDHQRECLLIFDGWDSFQSKTAPAMGLIAQGRAMQSTPVLFTYRPDCESIPSAVERTFEIRGFDEEQAREYIVKLLYSQGEQSSINKLTGFISKKKLWKRCSSPEYLNLLCFTFCHGKKEKGRSSWKIDI